MIEVFLHHEDIFMTRIKQKNTYYYYYTLFKLIINENNDTFKTKE